jgi:hypothetical protein
MRSQDDVMMRNIQPLSRNEIGGFLKLLPFEGLSDEEDND